jgi:hypothetical protein
MLIYVLGVSNCILLVLVFIRWLFSLLFLSSKIKKSQLQKFDLIRFDLHCTNAQKCMMDSTMDYGALEEGKITITEQIMKIREEVSFIQKSK